MAKKEKGKIVEPGELDVLCGRGGMSNHHPGNEWYRRLIKSNRPLYRACPKHTKLLVSKAIVQAVEQQGGRFLEKNRNDGSWYECTYKRAVDKTSQGLRERDREDDNNNNTAAPPPQAAQAKAGDGSFEVPDGFSGRSRETPNLSDLANVAIAQAQRTDGLPRNASGLVMPGSAAARARGSSPPKKRPGPQQLPPNKRMKNAMGMPGAVRGEGGGGEEDFAPLPPSLQQRESSMFRLLKQTKLLLQQSETWAGGAAPGGALEPRPPGVAGTPLLAAAGGLKAKYPTKLNNLPGNNNNNTNDVTGGENGLLNNNAASMVSRGKGAKQLSRMSAQPTGLAQAAQQATQQDEEQPQQQQQAAPYGQHAPPAYAPFAAGLQPPGFGAGVTALVQAPCPASQPPPNAATVPALTRLTSQMSDWLTSFWPLPTRGETQAGPTAAAAAAAAGGAPAGFQSQLANGAPGVAAPAGGALKNSNPLMGDFEKNVAPHIVNVPPLRIDPIQIKTIPPMKKRGSASSTENDPEDVSPPAARGSLPITKRGNKRKSTSTLPQLPPDHETQQGFGAGMQMPAARQPMAGNGAGDGSPSIADDPNAPAPTELEQSVSATLLKLAGTPGKLYTGLTNFFGSPSNRGGDGGGGLQPPQGGGGTAAAGNMVGIKRSSGSLLDDDDDEDDNGGGVGAAPPHLAQRMRAPKRNSASLLDDHEETPMEQRMRAVAWARPS